MRQGFGLVTLFTALFNYVLIAARSFVHGFFECLGACGRVCLSLVQLLRRPREIDPGSPTNAGDNIAPPPPPTHVDQESNTSNTSTARASDSSTTTNRSDRSTPSRSPPDSPPPAQIVPDPGEDLQHLGSSFSDESILSEP